MSDTPLTPSLVTVALTARAEAGRSSSLIIQGGSMSPLLQAGDLVMLASACHPLREGDILAYWTGHGVVVHRLLRHLPGGMLLLAGDNRPIADPPLTHQVILGRVIAVQTSSGQYSLDGRRARWIADLLVGCYPIRKYRLIQRLIRMIVSLTAQTLRFWPR